MLRSFIIIVIALIVCGQSMAQTFGGRLIVGANASQIAGDALAGFDKLGLSAGVKGTALLQERLHLNVEFLYSVKGSRPDIFNGTIDPDIDITLHYLELPVYISYSDWLDAQAGYYKAFAFGGLSFGRLISASTFDQFNAGDSNLDGLVDFFNQTDISWLIGFGFRIQPKFALSFRYTRSINLLLNATKNNLNTFDLRPYFISFRGEYIFGS